jgi:hypothetical protein
MWQVVILFKDHGFEVLSFSSEERARMHYKTLCGSEATIAAVLYLNGVAQRSYRIFEDGKV